MVASHLTACGAVVCCGSEQVGQLFQLLFALLCSGAKPATPKVQEPHLRPRPAGGNELGLGCGATIAGEAGHVAHITKLW